MNTVQTEDPCFMCLWYRGRIKKLTAHGNPRAAYWEDKMGLHLAWHAVG